MSDDILYKPRDLYEKTLKDQYHKAALEEFDSLKVESKVDPSSNSIHVKEYNDAKSKQDKKETELSSCNNKKIFVLILDILFWVVGVIMAVMAFVPTFNYILLLIGIALIGLAIGFIFLYKKFKKQALEHSLELEKLKAITKAKLDICYADMAPLNALFDWNLPLKVMEKATPIIDLDPTFSPERLAYLIDKFSFPESYQCKESIVGVISGNIQGNPFVLERVFSGQMRPKVYEGTLTITWTTHSRGSDGKSYTTTHTQTLHATSTHPAPDFEFQTRLVYGNEAAPHLSFSREPSGADKMDEKARRKEINRRSKELSKLAEKSLTSGKSAFTPMGNDEFDAFFGAIDRDNEVEFRLLFTPLAQSNMLELIENPNPFGDDFYMVKSKMLTSVASIHSQSFDYSANPINFAGYDYEQMKDRFVSYCDCFIQNLFFDLAPILSIPLYQMHKTRDYIYKNDYPNNITSYEQEVMANSLDSSYFIPEGADPSLPLVLKVLKGKKIGGYSDEVSVKATSYKTTPKVDYVPKMGGDGKMHNVPVHWIQYDEVKKISPITVSDTSSSRFDFSSKYPSAKALLDKFKGYHFERGLIALAGNGLTEEEDSQIHSTFSSLNK